MIQILLFLVYCSARQSINSFECDMYLAKFGSTYNTGEVTFLRLRETLKIRVDLVYFDPSFDNKTFFGLVKEDGKSDNDTCLDLKLWKFTSEQYTNPIEVIDLSFKNSSNSIEKLRYLSFTISSEDLSKRTIKSSNACNDIYTGYYSLAYYMADTTYLVFAFYFSFAVILNKESGVAIDTAFYPLNYAETINCNFLPCKNISLSTVLKQCTDLNCTAYENQNFYNHQLIILQQILTEKRMEDLYLVQTRVYYIADGLNQQVNYIKVNNTIPGQVIIQFNVDLIWGPIQVKAISYLSPKLDNSITYDPVTGVSDVISCVKKSADSLFCPNKEDWYTKSYDETKCNKEYLWFHSHHSCPQVRIQINSYQNCLKCIEGYEKCTYATDIYY